MVTEGGGGSIACGRFSFVHGLKAGQGMIDLEKNWVIQSMWRLEVSFSVNASNYSVGPGGLAPLPVTITKQDYYMKSRGYL